MRWQIRMDITGLRKELRELLSLEPAELPSGTSPFERFRVPYQYQPQTTVAGAGYFALVALVRIFLGSLLFAVWGATIWMVCATYSNTIVRVALVIPLLAGLAITMALLMIGISVCARRVRAWGMRRYANSEN